jgi:hypothetical protein
MVTSKEEYYGGPEYSDNEFDIGDLITIDAADIDLSNLTITGSGHPGTVTYSAGTVNIGPTYNNTVIHSNEVSVISEDGKEVKLLDELYRVSTELAVMRELMSTLLEKVKLDTNVELDFDKRVEHYKMLTKLAGE